MTASKSMTSDMPSSLRQELVGGSTSAHPPLRPNVVWSSAVSAFQIKPNRHGADGHSVSSERASDRSHGPGRASTHDGNPPSTLIKDGYVYKDEVVILDKEQKEKLLRVGEIELQSEWTFWYDRYVPNLPPSEYEANLQVISTVGTVQKFWSVYNNIDGPERLGFRSNLHFMRKNIKPIWEDPHNEQGGSYNFKIPKAQSPLAWRDLLVLLIGEKVEGWLGDTVCGVSVSSRQQCDNYQIWTAHSHHADSARDSKIRGMLIDLLQPAEIQSFYYKVHKNHAAFQKQPKWPENPSTAPPFEMRKKITEESIEKVVADIERLSLKQRRSNSSSNHHTNKP